MTLNSLLMASLALPSFLLLGCEPKDTPSPVEPMASAGSDTEAETSAMATAPQIDTGPSMAPEKAAVVSPDAAASIPPAPNPVPTTSGPTTSAKAAPALPPAPSGLMSFTSINPLGAPSRTTLLSRRAATPQHRIATLQIDNPDRATLMDIAFDCSARRYVYLYMDHNARPVDAAKVKRVQAFSDKQFTAFDRGQALQSLKFNGLDTLPPEDIANYALLWTETCRD